MYSISGLLLRMKVSRALSAGTQPVSSLHVSGPVMLKLLVPLLLKSTVLTGQLGL